MTLEEAAKIRALFSQRLQALLKENNMTQVELSRMVGVSESTIGKWILEKSLPRMGIIEKLANIFNRPKSYFFDENETRQTYYLNSETAALAQEIHDNPQYKVMFDATRKLKPQSIEEVMKFIDYQIAKEKGDADE